MNNKEQIILLHGIFDLSLRLKKLESFLKHKGYDTFNIDYPSTKYSIEELVEIVNSTINSQIDTNKTLHFIGYSMGGLIIRALINKYRPKKLGRVVQLAPPNKGSKIADVFKDNSLYKKIFGPAGQQLITNQEEFKHIFGNVDYELGIIAGDLSIEPLSILMTGEPNDGKVSVQNTKVKGMKDHITLKVGHGYFPLSQKVHKHALHFLKYGFFKK